MENGQVWRDKKIDFLAIVFAALFAAGSAALSQTTDQAWLRYDLAKRIPVITPLAVRSLGSGLLEQSAVKELNRNLGSMAGRDTSGPGFGARARAALDGQTVVGTAEEVRKAFPDLPVPDDLEPEGFWIYSRPCSDRYNGCGKQNLVVIAGGDERGVLYGVFALLRLADLTWSPKVSASPPVHAAIATTVVASKTWSSSPEVTSAAFSMAYLPFSAL